LLNRIYIEIGRAEWRSATSQG